MKNTAIVIVDVGHHRNWANYEDEHLENEMFINLLNHKLPQYQAQGVKLIEVNYISEKKHDGLSVKYNYSTTIKSEFINYIVKHKIDTLIYGGVHYGYCVHVGRRLGAENVKRFLPTRNVYACPWISRPHPQQYFKTLEPAVLDIPQVYL
jgi:isochorismate hydrolase